MRRYSVERHLLSVTRRGGGFPEAQNKADNPDDTYDKKLETHNLEESVVIIPGKEHIKKYKDRDHDN